MWTQVEQALNQSTTRVVSGIAQLLPGFVALIVALLFSAILAWLLSASLRRALKGVEFDARLGRWGLAGASEWSPSKSPTLLLPRLLFWGVMLIGFLVGVTAFDATLTSQFALRAFAYLPNLAAAALLLIVGNLIAQFLGRSVLIGAVNLNIEYARLLSIGVKWLIAVFAAAMALKHLSIGGGIVDLAFAILFGGIVLTLSLAVGLGSKDLVSRSIERQASKTARPEKDGVEHV
jgi:hypothetical protein